jgi:hypothetical protein
MINAGVLAELFGIMKTRIGCLASPQLRETENMKNR